MSSESIHGSDPVTAYRPTRAFSTINLCDMELAVASTSTLITHIISSLAEKRGGWVLTSNLDILRRHAFDEHMRALYDRADICVADGMPLVWASRIQGTPLPERVTGSNLIVPLCQAAAKKGFRVFLLGGAPGASDGAAARLVAECPNVIVCGLTSPQIGTDPTPQQIGAVTAELEAAKPDLVFVALGSPKQEKLICALRDRFPATWWIGVGIAFSLLAGQLYRAPVPVQNLGLEWAHRLVQEPRRLARRYLIDDLPFVFILLGAALRDRFRRALPRTSPD